MSTLIAIIIIIVVLAIAAKLYFMLKDRMGFIVNGLDSNFSIPEINTLWDVAQICEMDDPNALYYSLPALTKCMTQINNKAASGGDEYQNMQNIMTKLFAFRTRLQNESDQKKGLASSMDLDAGQRLRVILPGKGVFVSEIVNNGRELTISLPRQKNLLPVPPDDWVGKTVSVYLWRTGDARYVFDTVVENHGAFLGKLCLHLKHSVNLLRTQKRKAVRAKCNIHASLYILPEKGSVNYTAVETSPGLRCLLEDISEAGALIRIGGKGVPNMRLKLQFNINNKLILMFGVVRTVEYNEEINQTRLHFECTHIDQQMKNNVLSYVYNMMPETEKEIYDAMKMTANDEADAADDSQESGGENSREQNQAEKTDDSESQKTTAQSGESSEAKPQSEIQEKEEFAGSGIDVGENFDFGF